MKHYSTLCLLSIIATIALIMVSSCQSDKKETPDKAVQQLLPDASAEVTTTPLILVDFEHELVSNGKIKAQTVAELKFQTGEVIAKIFVKNGSHVQKGQRLQNWTLTLFRTD